MQRIKGISQHLGVLERRSTYLKERLDDDRLSDAARAFEARERKAIVAAVDALKVHKVLQEPTTSPVLALSALVDALDELPDAARQLLTPDVHDALGRARASLAMVEDPS